MGTITRIVTLACGPSIIRFRRPTTIQRTNDLAGMEYAPDTQNCAALCAAGLGLIVSARLWRSASFLPEMDHTQ